MEDQRQKERAAEFLKEEEPFRRNAFLIIVKMVELNDQVQQEAPDEARRDAQREAQREACALVDEILHSIFFLGNILNPSFPPESILSDDMINKLKGCFPELFKLNSTQLPRRSPFSCVLDMIVLLLGRENETDIIDGLRNLIKNLELGGSRDLVSSTICVSNRTDNKDQVKYYGVSMSAPGPFPRRLMIAASCLGGWDRYVAGAVMTYFPKKTKNPDFDGTIKLKDVRCQAFDLLGEDVKPPCRSCANMFGLTTAEIKVWDYGNCAENESLSNLFKHEKAIKDQARPTSAKYDEKREKVENDLKKELRKWLGCRGFKWNDKFYSPQ